MSNLFNQVSINNNNKGAVNMNMHYYVNGASQFENLRSEFNRKEKMVNVVLLKIFEDHIEESVMPIGFNIETPSLKLEDGVLVKTSANSVRFIDRFCPEMINLDFSKSAENIEIFGDRVFVVGYNQGFDRKIYVANRNGNTVYDIIQCIDVDASVIYNEDGSIKTGVYAFSGQEGGQGASASQMRKGTITLYANQDLNRAHNLRDLASYGAINTILGESMTEDEEFKFGGARLNQYKAPSCKHSDIVENIAVFCGTWTDEFGDDWYDGGSFTSTRFKAAAFSDDKFKVAERAVLGTASQIRPYNTKTQEISVDQCLLSEFINSQGKAIFLCREDITEDDQLHFNMLFRKATKRKSKFYGKILIITSKRHQDINLVDLYVDLNAMKMTHDLRRISGYNMLDMAKVTSDLDRGAKTSMQPLQSLFYANPGAALAWLMKTAETHLNESLEKLLSKEARVPSLGDFTNLYVARVIGDIAPEFAMEKSAKLAHTLVDNFIKGMVRDISKLKFCAAGAYLKIVPDMGMLYKLHILNKGEVYSPAAEKYFAAKGIEKSEWYVAQFKFPKMHPLEFGCDRAVSFAEIVERINASNLTDKQKWSLRRLFKSFSAAIIIVPAIEINKKKLAGMDYDSDALEAYFDPEFVSILRTKEPLAINIINDAKKAEAEEKPFTRNAGWKAFVKNIKNANKSVGEITVMNDVIIALLIGLLQGKLEAEARYVLGKAFEGEHCIEQYESPLTTYLDEQGHNIVVQDVSEALGDKICANIAATELTVDNMIGMLLDLASVERMLQERTIDSAKTNDRVKEFYDLNKIARLLSRSDMSLRIVWNDKDEEDYEAISESKEIRTKDRINYLIDTKFGVRVFDTKEGKQELCYVMDQFHEVRVELMRKLYVMAAKLAKIDPKFTDSEIADFKKVANRADIKPVYDALIECKNMYSDMTGIMRREIVDKAEEEVRLVNEEYKRNIKELSNQVRVLTSDLDPVTRAKLLIEIGRNSNFAFTVCSEEFLHFVIAEHADVDFAGERLDKCTFEVGETVSFVGGMANAKGKVAWAKSNVTGDFVIREHAGKLYASKLITELVTVPAINKSTVLFKTHASEAGNAASIIEKLNTGAVVTLKPFANNAIVLGEERVAKFHCAANGRMAMMYNNAQGVVKQTICGKTVDRSGKLRSVVIVVLEDTVNLEVTEAELTEAKKVAAKEKAAKRAARKTFGIKFISGNTVLS